MPLNNEDLPTDLRREFCLFLKTAREHKGITLDTIATATKIPAYLFAGLERNDLRRWPKGFFRRSFFRDYIRTVGLPDDLCAEFVRLFPDDPGAAVAAPAAVAGDANQESDLRLSLDPEWHGPRSPVLLRLLAASLDAAVVILSAAAIAWVAGINQPATTAVLALAYFSLATAVLGETPASWAISRRDAIARLFASTIAKARPEPTEESEAQPWMSDAHRVGSPRLRVRIKVS
jgi:Helix-turn-helix domain